MSNITIFDCSQLLTFVEKEKNDYDKIFENLQKDGYIVSSKNQIEERKLEYLKDYLGEEVIEIVDQEFQGEFEDWKEKENMPQKLRNLIYKLEQLQVYFHNASFKLIVVSNATENKTEDIILEVNSTTEDLTNKLFLMSWWNFQTKVDTLIIDVN
ncbi:hypothetical protein [Planococcus maritimus]|uniref:hypothetical protein n=1 Tax=Planococcus maritimus TaxID=192421 RepID=UPI00079B3509|nr:hypothetical protein [Planococcus maritimus]KYG60021.1 hypothetical protein AY633_07260 [Planococcus maritimus]OED33709.1 hypothetical protein BHE17_15115 [Planococcus maritimus]